MLRFKPSSTLWPASGVRASVPRPTGALGIQLAASGSLAPLNDWCTVRSPLSPYMLRMRIVQAMQCPSSEEGVQQHAAAAAGDGDGGGKRKVIQHDEDDDDDDHHDDGGGGYHPDGCCEEGPASPCPSMRKPLTSVCETCGRRFDSVTSLASHMRSHNRRYDCPECGLVFVDARRRNHHRRSVHQRKEFPCPDCDKVFPFKGRLEAHRLVHNPDSPQFRCDACSFVTIYPITYKQHVRRHAKDFSIFCDECGRGFFSPSTLAIHVKTVHDKVKPFECDKCDRRFSVASGLRYHVEEVHEKPPDGCTCEQCGKRCASLPALRRHLRKQHGSEGKRCICEHCGKELANKASLQDHLRTHTGEKPFACRYCGDSFAKKQVMIVHERVQHEGERRHKCKECGKTFTQRSPYVIHMRLHTGERPYPCTVCSASFISRSALNSHLKNHK